MTKICTALLKSVSPYSQSRPINDIEKPKGISHDAWENQRWRDKMHIDPASGEVLIPAMSLKFALDAAARMKGERIKGRGQKTYLQFFLSGIIVGGPIRLGIKAESVRGEDIFVSAKAIRGSGGRVWRRFPIIDRWEAAVTFTVIDAVIDEKVFEEHLVLAGLQVGIGRFRPEVGGDLGRFRVDTLDWAAA